MKNEGYLAKNQPVKREILRPNFERFGKKKKKKKTESTTDQDEPFTWFPQMETPY